MSIKVGFSETFPVIGKDRWQKIWIEDDSLNSIDIANCSDEEIEKLMKGVRKIQYAIKKQVQDFFYESNRVAEKELLAATPSVEIPSKEKQIANIIASIYTCTELKTLECYFLISKSDPQIKAAYDSQFDKLTKNT